MDYIATGNVMTDIIIDSDGKLQPGRYIGGPALYSLAGIKNYTDSCMIVTNVGADFFDYYNQWLDDNNIDKSGIKILAEHTGVHELAYVEDGSYLCESIYGPQHRGYLKVRPEDIEPHLKGVKGVTISQKNERILFDDLKKLKDKYGFKLMWEIECLIISDDKLKDVIETVKKIDYFSINYSEMKKITGCSSEKEATDILKKFPCEAVWFRVGAKGGYVIKDGKSYFIPTPPLKGKMVDATGCGNSTTATIMYALTEGYDPIMAGIMANVMAGYNVRQCGPFPIYTSEVQIEALAYAKKLYIEYKVRG